MKRFTLIVKAIDHRNHIYSKTVQVKANDEQTAKERVSRRFNKIFSIEIK